jgi:hypothetical protein
MTVKQNSNNKNAKTRIYILNLDDFIATEEKPTWIQQKLFSPLDVELSFSEAQAYINTTENRNSTMRATGTKRKTVLPEAVSEIFKCKIDEINNVVADFNNIFEVHLTSILL